MGPKPGREMYMVFECRRNKTQCLGGHGNRLEAEEIYVEAVEKARAKTRADGIERAVYITSIVHETIIGSGSEYP